MDLARQIHDAAKRDLTTETLCQFGEVRLRVTGTSMLPSIWPGDVITVRRQCASELLPGRIVLCYRKQAFFAHRLVGKRNDRFITRGDSLSYDDPPFRDVEVLGAVVSILRGGRPVAISTARWHHVASSIVRRSELFTRILLRLQGSSWAR
jgi:signal peptidase I